jgi:predicted nuclease of restriction endonuclease-like (RecB) superfamily
MKAPKGPPLPDFFDKNMQAVAPDAVDGYGGILRDVKEILQKVRSKAYYAVDKLKVEAYWEIGERIARGELENKHRADYGKAVIMKLSHDTDIDKSTLYDAYRLYKTYPIFRAVSGKLSWTILRKLIYIEDSQEREFYRMKAREEDWSSRQLVDALKNKIYQERGEERSIGVVKKAAINDPQEVFRQVYDFGFLNLASIFKECDLENALVGKVIRVLMELGKNFCLVGKQVPILIDGNWDRVDLVFYHTRLHCYILVELKKGPFKKQYVGQINTYIEYYRHNNEAQGDNPTIGLILCEDIGHEEAVYALGGLEKKIFVAQYRLVLPSEKQIVQKLKEIKQ